MLVCLQSGWRTRKATPSNCGKFLSNIRYRPGIERLVQRHQGETRGYGKNSYGRDNPQPSPKAPSGAMDAVQRLNVGGSRFLRKPRHKIESVPVETRSERGIMICCKPSHEESFQGLIYYQSEATLAFSN